MIALYVVITIVTFLFIAMCCWEKLEGKESTSGILATSFLIILAFLMWVFNKDIRTFRQDEIEIIIQTKVSNGVNETDTLYIYDWCYNPKK